jgi:hypothetical protein
MYHRPLIDLFSIYLTLLYELDAYRYLDLLIMRLGD